MSLDAQLLHRLERGLSQDRQDGRGRRLIEDARRLCGRLRLFIRMSLASAEPDQEALELACFALQIPLRTGSEPRPRLGLRERAEEAAELLLSQFAGGIEENLLERAAQLLRQLPDRKAALPEARLLADALNLDDFGISGLLRQAHGGESAAQVADGCEKREQYGYWEARLEGFHFEPVRQVARRRLENARQAARFLIEEQSEEGE